MANNPFGKMPGGLGELMKQAQKAMEDAQKVEAELDEARVEGQAGGGLVKVVATGKADILSIKIAKEVVDPEDVESLEDLVTLAVREAVDKANSMREERLKSVMPAGMGSGSGLGGLF
ncbi:MAG: YbaB/EbfC family nucleoid-associated protein [Janthinobacterium lividum]